MIRFTKYIIPLLSILLSALFTQKAFSQCKTCTLEIKQYCENSELILEASTNGIFKGWKDALGTTDTSRRLILRPEKTQLYSATATFPARDTILNGDFEAGNSGFESDYTFKESSFESGNYSVVKNPEDLLDAYVKIKDHTTGTGNMLVADGSTSKDKEAYRIKFRAEKGRRYIISFWTANIHEEFGKTTPDTSQNKPAVIQTLVGQTIISTFRLPTDILWHQIKSEWIAEATGDVFLAIRTGITSVKGNDFAIDDVELVSESEKTMTVTTHPCNSDPVISPDGDGLYDTYFISEPGYARIIDLGGNIVNEFPTPAVWHGSKKNGTLADAGYYAVVVNDKIFRVSLIR